MKKVPAAPLLSCLVSAALLCACAELPFSGGNNFAGAHKHAAPRHDQLALREGINLYNEGDFNGAIRRLSSSEIAAGSVNTRLAALKYTAFSYCVTARPAPCRQSFEKALRLDPSFDLAPGERGHPQWGPVFKRAKDER